MTVAYLRETAEQAGLETDSISMEDIGWDRLSGRFVDKKLRFIRSCFKLYPGNGSPPTAFAPHVLGTSTTAAAPAPLSDRARLEDAAVQQGAARGAVGNSSPAIRTSFPPT